MELILIVLLLISLGVSYFSFIQTGMWKDLYHESKGYHDNMYAEFMSLLSDLGISTDGTSLSWENEKEWLRMMAEKEEKVK